MQISHHVEELQRQLLTAAAAGGPEAQDLADRLTAALESAARLVLFEVLSDAAGEITRDLAPGRWTCACAAATSSSSSPSPLPTRWCHRRHQPRKSPPPTTSRTGATSRTTLRLPDSLKARAEAAATASGVSLNTWFVRAVGAALEPRRATPQTHGNSYTGWVR